MFQRAHATSCVSFGKLEYRGFHYFRASCQDNNYGFKRYVLDLGDTFSISEIRSGTQINVSKHSFEIITQHTSACICKYSYDQSNNWQYKIALSSHGFASPPFLDCLQFSDPGPPRCHVLALISAILWGANTSIDTTGKARDREGGKQLSTDELYLNNHLELRNLIYVKCNISKN